MNCLYNSNRLITSASSVCVYLFTLVCVLVPLGVTVRYEEEMYSVDEEAGYITLALVLDGEASVNVTVNVSTLDLQDSSIGDAATGELMQFASCRIF